MRTQKKDIITRYGNRYSPEEWELKKQLEQEEWAEPNTAATAEKEFRAELTQAGIKAESIERLVAMGPVKILSQLEAGSMRFFVASHEAIIEKAVNRWGRKL